MIEVYILTAVIANIIADMLIWNEVKRMSSVHNELLKGFTEFCESIGPALTEHAKRVTKGVTGAIGYYQGKARDAGSDEIEGLSGIVDALGPLANLVGMDKGKSSTNNSDPKYHT